MPSAKKTLSLLVLLALASAASAQPAAPPPLKLAVLTIRPGDGVRAYRADELAERLRLHLPGLIYCQSLSGDELVRVLREKRMSSESRTPDGYAEIGRAIGVDYVIYGKLDQKQENLYRIDLHLVGVREGHEVSTAQREVAEVNFANVLGEPLRSLAGILVAGLGAAARPSGAVVAATPSPEAATSTLEATSAVTAAMARLSPEQRDARLRAIRRRLCESMLEIPAGRFVMGSETGQADETPRQYVFVDRFYIDRYEVTNRDYSDFVAFTGHNPPPQWKNGAYAEGADNFPVSNVSFRDAVAYAEWAGLRLPTEREWEKAARGQDGRTYSFGDIFDASVCNTWENHHGDTVAVDSYSGGRSPYGLYNCVGNVWEWVDAWYQAYPDSPCKRAEFGETFRVLRGGGWNMDAYYARCSSRYYLEPHYRHPSFGFRCALSPEQYEALSK